ncbi:MAG: hypothetical protein ACTSU9_16840 [Promethearchaeota archaeon]
MATLKEKKENIGKRTSITRVLLSYGFTLVFLVWAILAFLNWAGLLNNISVFTPERGILSWIILATLGILFWIMSGKLSKKYRNTRTEEQTIYKISKKDLVGPFTLMLILISTLTMGFLFFIKIGRAITTAPDSDRNFYFVTLALLLIFMIGSIPFLMVLWYRAPKSAGRIILPIFRMFNKKSKKKVAKIMVIKLPQSHSFWIALKRSFTAMTFALFTTFTLWIPLVEISGSNRLKLTTPPLVPNMFNPDFLNFCNGFIIHMGIPLILSFFLWFWVLPSCWLLDDSGVVFFRKHLKRRQPAEMKTVSSWFLSLVKAVVGTSGLYAYIARIVSYIPLFNQLAQQTVFGAIQFGIFVIGFPFFGVMLIGFILLIFMDTQFNKLKTFTYQEMVKLGLDARVVDPILDQTDDFQEHTLLGYYGENFFHHPPLNESKSKFTKIGEYTDDELLKKEKG